MCLDTEDPPAGNLSGLQIEYFAKALKDNSDVLWTMVFTHKPLWEEEYKSKSDWGKFEKLLEGRQYSVFAGHYHNYKETLRKGQSYYRLATTGGFSELTGPSTGQFDHIVWVTMTEDGPRIANLTLEGILE